MQVDHGENLSRACPGTSDKIVLEVPGQARDGQGKSQMCRSYQLPKAPGCCLPASPI